MKPLATFLVLMSLSIPVHVHASGSDESIAQVRAAEQARKESDARYAAEQAEQRRKTAAQEQELNAQTAAAIRPMLGAAAVGKSDAEVVRMYEEKVARDDASGVNEDAAAAGAATTHKMTNDVTGYSIEDMGNMSDQELDRLEQQTLEKYKR